MVDRSIKPTTTASNSVSHTPGATTNHGGSGNLASMSLSHVIGAIDLLLLGDSRSRAAIDEQGSQGNDEGHEVQTGYQQAVESPASTAHQHTGKCRHDRRNVGAEHARNHNGR